MGGTDRQRTRSRERLERLSTSALGCESIQREAVGELQRLIGFDRWCWPLADPTTLLPLGGAAEHDYGPRVPRALELEYSGGDFAAKDVLARSASSVGCLSAETGGDLARSPRWDEVMRTAGIGDIAVVACRDALGCWGWMEAYRDRGDQPFREEDVAALLAGSDTHAVTERLLISAHTVQDHLKSVFEKMSIHSRREMLAMFNASQDRR